MSSVICRQEWWGLIETVCENDSTCTVFQVEGSCIIMMVKGTFLCFPRITVISGVKSTNHPKNST